MAFVIAKAQGSRPKLPLACTLPEHFLMAVLSTVLLIGLALSGYEQDRVELHTL